MNDDKVNNLSQNIGNWSEFNFSAKEMAAKIADYCQEEWNKKQNDYSFRNIIFMQISINHSYKTGDCKCANINIEDKMRRAVFSVNYYVAVHHFCCDIFVKNWQASY